MSTKDLRRRWRQYWEQDEQAHNENVRIAKELLERKLLHSENITVTPNYPRYPDFPEDLVNLTCSAKTRSGTPCKIRLLYINGRCRFHGGLSTGPTTRKGKAKAARNGFKPKRTL